MLKRYSEQEMLDYWKGRLGISVSPAVAGYRDRTALDRKILDEVDLWYEEMLQSAPFDKVPVSDMAEAVSCRRLTDNSVEIALPEEAVRMVALRLQDWDADEVECYSQYSDTARLQRNRLTRATVDDPAVISRPGVLEVHGLDPEEEEEEGTAGDTALWHRPYVKKLQMVTRPAKGTYVLDPVLLRRSELRVH